MTRTRADSDTAEPRGGIVLYDRTQTKEAQHAVEAWESEGGAQPPYLPSTEDPLPQPALDPPVRNEAGMPPDRPLKGTETSTSMNHTLTRAMHRRDLSQWIAYLHRLAAEQTVQREASIRRHGIAHPRSIAVSRRLNETLSAGRHLHSVYRASGHEARGKSQELRRTTTAVELDA